MKKDKTIMLFLISIIFLSGCDALKVIASKVDVEPYDTVKIEYDREDDPYYSVYIQRQIADAECIRNDMIIRPGMDHAGIIEYTYSGGGLLSDPDGNIYFYDKDGFIYDKDGNPNSDKVDFYPSTSYDCVDIPPKAGSYAKTFDAPPLEPDDHASDSEPAASAQGSPSSGAAPENFTTSAETIGCYGNVIWADFFPNAPDYNARAEVQSFPIQLTFDFENGLVEGEFCSSGENPNDGWTQGSADFCVSVKDSDLYPEFGGTWGFDGVWDVELDMSAAQLHWFELSEEWAYNSQHSRFDAPFHGWLEPAEGSLYTDEVQPATFQFLCDINPPQYIFN